MRSDEVQLGPGDGPPADKYHMAYLIFFLQGVGMLFPWNVFITAEQYYHVRFCGSHFVSNFLNFFGICFSLSNVSGLALAVAFQRMINPRLRVIVPLWTNFAVFIVTAMLVLVPLDQLAGNSLFGVTVPCVVMAGLATSFLQGGIFGLAGQMPPVYTQAVMSGQGLAGVTVAVSSVVITAARSQLPDDECDIQYATVKNAALAYFLIACGVIVLCIISYYYLEALPIVQHYAGRGIKIAKKSKSFDANMEALLGGGGGGGSDEEMYGLSDGSGGLAGTGGHNKSRFGRGTVPSVYQQHASVPQLPTQLADAEEEMIPSSGRARTRWVFGKVQWLAFSVFVCFSVTLSLFPSVTAKILAVSTDSNRFFHDLFVPFSFVMFNLFDWLGRNFAGWAQIIPADRLWIFVGVRVVFFPLFLLCNVGGPHLVFDDDAWPILFMAIFAFSNGYLASLCMMYGPGMVPGSAAEDAGTMMVFFLTAGIASGSFLSFGFLPLTRTN